MLKMLVEQSIIYKESRKTLPTRNTSKTITGNQY